MAGLVLVRVSFRLLPPDPAKAVPGRLSAAVVGHSRQRGSSILAYSSKGQQPPIAALNYDPKAAAVRRPIGGVTATAARFYIPLVMDVLC